MIMTDHILIITSKNMHGVTAEYAPERHIFILFQMNYNNITRSAVKCECLGLHKSSLSFTKVALNSATMVVLMYDDDNSRPHIKPVLFDNITLELV